MDWKRALIFGSFAAAGIFLVTGKRPAALAAAGVGLATLAAEYPDRFEELWERAPEYLEKGNRFVDMASQFLNGLAEQAGNYQQRAGSRY